jgi:hypothetical protein
MSGKTRGSGKKSKKTAQLSCVHCEKIIADVDQALFVEEEVGRYFCGEPCIVGHFTPEIEKLEREYGRHVSANDLSSEERERFAHLRWMCLENPGEVWKEKVKSGDDRYTLIAEYHPEQKAVWAVASCLMLRGDPSFLYLAFVTSDRHLVDVFRRGEQMSIVKNGEEAMAQVQTTAQESTPPALTLVPDTAHLAEPWTEADSVRANLIKARKNNDIPMEDFGFYQKCLEESLQDPNELWSYLPKSAKRIYHFLKQYDHDESFWYVVIAKDTVDETQIEIVDAFPTRDASLVALCRHGKKEVLGSANSKAEDTASEGPIAETARRNVH